MHGIISSLLIHIFKKSNSIKKKFQETESNGAVRVPMKHIQKRKGGFRYTLDAGLVVTECNETESERHVSSSRSGKDTHAEDADINFVNDKQPKLRNQGFQEFMYDEQGQWLLITSDQHPCFMIMVSVDNTSGPAPQRKEECTLQCALSSKEEKSSLLMLVLARKSESTQERIAGLGGKLNNITPTSSNHYKLKLPIERLIDKLLERKKVNEELRNVRWWEIVRRRPTAATKDPYDFII
ncbi:hypothetical protein Tco_0824373 [Tanacetum coccineum]|uniref:Uncharacterized protein n=1 Tax=Tanacetum coccineum TaxID=301880 RepID=A0ABQ5AQK1_9ASTR